MFSGVADLSGRDVSGALTGALCAYVRRRAGDDGLALVVALAGDRRPIDAIEDPNGWSSFDEAVALFDGAADVTGDPDVARRIGEELVPRAAGASGTIEILRSLGSPGEVLRSVSMTAGKYTAITRMEALEVGDSHAVVSSMTLPPHPRSRHFCLYTMGSLSRAPMLFGMEPAEVTELECQAEGAPACVYRVEWDPTTSPQYDPRLEIQHLKAQLTGMAGRFEALQEMACQLVLIDNLDDGLQEVTRRARLAVRAPHFLLAVRTSPGGPLRLHYDGLSPTEAEALVAEVLAPEPDERDGSRLVVDVASGRAHFGRLAAVHAEGQRFFPAERRLLAAYAGNAAAALVAAAALENARARERTSNGLLELARSLAAAKTREEVAERLARAVPDVVDCDIAHVLLWDASSETLALASAWDVSGAAARVVRADLVVDAPDCPELTRIREDPRPILVSEGIGELVGDAFGRNLAAGAVAPITAKGVFYGMVVASVESDTDRLTAGPSSFGSTLAGIADQAATALENADLLQRIRHQALHDALTGTPNQRLLEDRVATALALARRHPEHLALLFLDLDRFKVVNDTLGHALGDELLQEVARRLQSVVRSSDTVARLGGDEFAMLLPRLDSALAAERVASKLLAALDEPLTVGQHRIYITGSIGVAVYPDHGSDYNTLLKHADAAMYQAKARGRGVYHVYDSASGLARDHTHLALEADLHGAVARGELRVVYQPQVDLSTMEVVGAEALVRWQHPEQGLLGPDQFIPLAEETGLIVEIDAWVLRTACQQLAAWRAAGLPAFRVAVNLSGRDLRDPALPGRVAREVTLAGIDPSQIELEVTERVVEGSHELLPVLDALHALGVRLAIDDFGTGNSAFSRLSRGRIDVLKIDKGFIRDIDDDRADAPLVAAMISLAHSLGLEVVAEGVETDAQGAFLRRRGCKIMQGYAFSRPVPPEEFERLALLAGDRC